MELIIESRRMRYSMCGGEERCIQGFGGEDSGVNWRIILRWIFRRCNVKV